MPRRRTAAPLAAHFQKSEWRRCYYPRKLGRDLVNSLFKIVMCTRTGRPEPRFSPGLGENSPTQGDGPNLKLEELQWLRSLTDAVVRWLDTHPHWLEGFGSGRKGHFAEPAELFVGPPPILTDRPPPRDLDKKLSVARNFDVAGRDARNRALGRAGEWLVAERERATMVRRGLDDLAARVRWVSEEDGGGLGYDIASFDLSG